MAIYINHSLFYHLCFLELPIITAGGGLELLLVNHDYYYYLQLNGY